MEEKSEHIAAVRRISVETCFQRKRKYIASRLLQEALKFCQKCDYNEVVVEIPGTNRTKIYRMNHSEIKIKTEVFVARQGWQGLVRSQHRTSVYHAISYRLRDSSKTNRETSRMSSSLGYMTWKLQNAIPAWELNWFLLETVVRCFTYHEVYGLISHAPLQHQGNLWGRKTKNKKPAKNFEIKHNNSL